MKHHTATAQLARELERARRAIGVERLAPALVPPLLLAAAWAAAALFGAQRLLFPLFGSLAAIAALLGVGFLLVRAGRRWRRPTPAEARARLAADSGFDPSAFDTLDDQPAKLDVPALALWEHEQARAWSAAGKAAAAPPRLGLNRADPLRLRFAAGLALLLGLIVAGIEAPDRLARAFLPDPGPFLGDGPMQIEAWATPAAYTGDAPVSLSDRIGKRVDTPPSIETTVRVTGPAGPPRLQFDGRGIHRTVAFKKAADGAYEAKLQIPVAGVLRVVRFHTQARWMLAPGADAAPSARFDGEPKITGDKIAFRWKAGDDFGVRELALRVTPVAPPAGLAGFEGYDTPVEGPHADPKTTEGEAEIDLTAHPFAGLKVKVAIVARDALGQEGASPPAPIALPEKIFLQPLARAAIEIRKQVMWERRPYDKIRALRPDQIPAMLQGFDPLLGRRADPIRTDEFDPRIERAPSAIRRAGRMLDALTFAPGDGYFQDMAVFAGFKAARAQISAAREIGETDETGAILWQTAMRAEYGDAADARRALTEAQRQLAEAIARGAGGDEIDRLSQAVRDAMKNYMQALMAEAQRNGATQESQEDTREKTELSQNDLDAMMQEVQRLAKEGKTAEAQALLERLSSLLENLEIRLASSGGGQGGPEGKDKGDAELNQSAEDLSNAIGQQRALRDDTQKREQQPGGKSGEELAERQRQLGEALDAAKEKSQRGGAGEGAQDLADAGKAMGEAEQALKRGEYGAARRQQDEALKHLRAGADRVNREIMRRQEARQGGAEKDRASGQRDPLGRMMGGVDNKGDDVAVPDSIARERVRDILDELRRRAQDPRRPDAERDYLRRLLDRFTGS